jgi:hypothetical protein
VFSPRKDPDKSHGTGKNESGAEISESGHISGELKD